MSVDFASLGRRVKEKYSDYADIPDEELGRQVATKFPEYQTASVSSSETSDREYRTRRGALRFHPEETDWTLSRLSDVENEFQKRTGRRLPVSVRGQGRIHNRLDYEHSDSADIGVHPNSDDGNILGSILREKKFPFLAFDRAIPGVSSGPHYHLGHPSKRRGAKKKPSADAVFSRSSLMLDHPSTRRSG